MNCLERIRILCEKHGISIHALERKTGVSNGTIGRWDKHLPSNSKLKLIADYFGVTTDFLLYGDIEKSETLATESDKVQIPVYGTIPAGPPIEAEQYIMEYIEIPAEWQKGGKEYFGLIVRGDSMYPQFIEGDIVILRRQSTIEQGKPHAVYVNGYNATLKKVTISQEGITLTPANTNYSPRTYGANDEPVTVCGVVVESRRRF